jgi:hypothetical protein
MVEVRTRPRKAVGALGRIDAGRPRRGCEWYHAIAQHIADGIQRKELARRFVKK